MSPLTERRRSSSTRRTEGPNVIRAKIVLLAAPGLSNDVIAARLDTPRQIASKGRKVQQCLVDFQKC